MRAPVQELEKAIALWPGVSVHAHRFAGREFRFGSAEIGHIHAFGSVDIPFTRAIRDKLLAEGLAEEHRWVPNSGWVTFSLQSHTQVPHALWLMRLSYLRYALKRGQNPEEFLKRESETLGLSSEFVCLLRQFVTRTSEAVSNAPMASEAPALRQRLRAVTRNACVRSYSWRSKMGAGE